jgi:phasin family protein
MEQAYTDVLKNVSEVNKQAMESVLRFNRIAMRAQGLLARQQLSAMESYLDAGTRHLDLVGKTQDPQEMVKLATEINVELGERLMALAQESMDIQAQARDEVTSWIEDGMKAVQKQAEKQTESVTKVTKAAAKPAPKKAAASASAA